MKRRDFITKSAIAGIGLSILPSISFPEVLTSRRSLPDTQKGDLIFRPYLPQKGRGPHLGELIWASDTKWNTFYSNIKLGEDGIKISNTFGRDKFGITARWNVEGFGYLNITADNGGEYYELPSSGKRKELNLNYELAKSRVARNNKRFKKFSDEGWNSSKDVKAFLDLSNEYFDEASRYNSQKDKCAQLAQQSLYYAMWGGEKMELEKARYDILRNGPRPDYLFGCDARAFYQMNQELFFELFAPLFNFAKVTYIQRRDGIIGDLEPIEGKLQFEIRDLLIKRFRENNITCDGRALFWFHHWVTPDWLKSKNYDQLKKYVEKHTYDVVKHSGTTVYAWELVNELHDWANEMLLTPEQAVEITKLACDVAYSVEPKVHRLVNNCCPFAEYIQLKEWSGQEAKYRQRSPYEFTKDLIDAGVNFDIVGQQLYFPDCDLQDSIIYLESLKDFNKAVQLTEVGCPAGPTPDTVKTGEFQFPKEPYVWHRYWDEDTQAEWFEGIYTLAFSKPYIESISWFDFVDPYSYMENGGLLKSPRGQKKSSYDRMKILLDSFRSLPVKN